jgi:2-oxoglutarate ferredoxin oxidoreductase subunit alpha
LVPAPIVEETDGATIGIVSLGTNDEAIQEARSRMGKAGLATSYLRLLALPLSKEVRAFVAKYDKIYVVENNFDGQLHLILSSELPDLATKMVSVAKCDGLPLSARWITEQIA